MKIFVANVTATTEFDGRRLTIRRGTTMVNEDDPFLVDREEMFTVLEVPYIGEKPAKASEPVKAPVEPVKTPPVASKPAVVPPRKR